MPFGPGLSCFAPSPGKPGLDHFGLRSLSRAPRRPHAGSLAAWLRARRSGRRERGHAFREVPEAGNASPSWDSPAAVSLVALGRRCEGAPGFGAVTGACGPVRR